MTDFAVAPARHARLDIDLDALRANYRFLKSQASGGKLIAVIKADAYGHGALEVARALAQQADAFAVATVGEAMALRRDGIDQRIVVLGGASGPAEMATCASHRLDPVIHQFVHLDWLAALPGEAVLDIWIKLDSGMGRLGFAVTDFPRAIGRARKLASVARIRLMTHLANADDRADPRTHEQLQRVRAQSGDDLEWCVANSAGLLAWPDSHRRWSRTGIALYGSEPMQRLTHGEVLQPVMTFRAPVLAINPRQKGERIGYGGLYRCPADSLIAVIGVGYADGYPRHLQGGYVVINGQRAAVVGRVSMDMITIDVTDLKAAVGDEVILWGSEPLASEIARLSETIAYELFCHAGCHGRKTYVGR